MVEYQKLEGAKIVEMEQAGFLAVTQFRNIKYGGDDVSQTIWNSRNWQSRMDIRASLVEICCEIIKIF